MKIIKQSAEIVDFIDGQEVLRKLEQCGRVCYQSEAKLDSALEFVKRIISRGHESVLEHFSLTVRFITDRGVSHEIVRHRLASYSQESTRYCNYSDGKFGNEITVILPCGISENTRGFDFWKTACEHTEYYYTRMIEEGATPQEARSVLPNSLKTELMMTANIREWRHFFKLRTAPAAHPQMRELALMLLVKMQQVLPGLFDDIGGSGNV